MPWGRVSLSLAQWLQLETQVRLQLPVSPTEAPPLWRPRPCGGPAHRKGHLCDYPSGSSGSRAGGRTASRVFRVSWMLCPTAPNSACPSILPILPVQFPDPPPLGVPSQGSHPTVSPLVQPKTQKTASPHQHTEGKADSVREGRHPETDQNPEPVLEPCSWW